MNKLKAAILVGIAGSLPVFSSAPAHANIDPFTNLTYAQITAPGAEFKVGDKIYYDFMLPKASNNINYFSDPDIVYGIRALNADKYSWQASFLNVSVANPATPVTLTYSYKVRIDPAGRQYASFTTGGTFNPNGMTPMFTGTLEATKVGMPTPILGTSTYTYPSSNMGNTASLSSIPPYVGPLQFNGKIVITKQTTLTNITDTLLQVPVPGPLPVVGAAAAFGFSRKLRKRVKATA